MVYIYHDSGAGWAYTVAKQQEKLGDLQDKAGYLAKTSGQSPVSWYEFQKSIPKGSLETTSHTLFKFGAGALAGAVFGILAAMMLPPVSAPLAIAVIAVGAIAGGAIGSNLNIDDNYERGRMIDQYEAYLDGFEASVERGRAYAIDKMPPAREGENVTRLRQGFEQQAAMMAK